MIIIYLSIRIWGNIPHFVLAKRNTIVLSRASHSNSVVPLDAPAFPTFRAPSLSITFVVRDLSTGGAVKNVTLATMPRLVWISLASFLWLRRALISVDYFFSCFSFLNELGRWARHMMSYIVPHSMSMFMSLGI